MNKKPPATEDIVRLYQKRAAHYDSTLKLFNLFSLLGFNIPLWRKKAIEALNLKRGDIVVDIGCGTGANFSFIEEKIGPDGKIIGVDLSPAMLARARQLIVKNNWRNIRLVHADAQEFTFPDGINGVIAAFSLILMSHPGQVILNAHRALRPGGYLVIFDMAWPRYIPFWFRHILFFLQSYGLSGKILHTRPWEIIAHTTNKHFRSVREQKMWMGFFYLLCGKKV